MDLFRSRARGEPVDSEQRFDRLYREQYGRVLAYALRRAAPEVAHDVVADTFLVAWRRLERLPDEPLPWLLGIARKTLANHRRGARRRDALVSELKAQGVVALHADAGEPALTVAEIAAALERLPESERELVLLVAWEGLEVAGAARVLGVSASTCRVRLHRARRRLAGELAGEEVRAPHQGRFPSIAKELR